MEQPNKADIDRDKYQLYMQIVTDAFINMQSDKIKGTIGHEKDSCFYTVLWDEGLRYTLELDCSLYMKGITFEEAKVYNASIALKYLKSNTLTFEEWFEKYGT